MRAVTKRGAATDITPWRDLDVLSERMRTMMEPLGPWVLGDAAWSPLLSNEDVWAPVVELVEGEGEYVLSAELPGISKDDIDVSVDDHVLTLKGEKRSEKAEDQGKTHILERRYGSFERSFTLPRNVDAKKITASFKDGIMEVRLPKGEGSKAKHIKIQ